ncbi:hypothetical protein SNE40_003298 [Patella caerulea]|uniref:Uncharacterized protein n=1 Tax=Patella caerulea TaxID=87958 RepID=A0AAN8K7K6_PATCE
MASNGTSEETEPKEQKKEEEFDFFAPHPNPKPRVKNSFFEMVPDAYSEKSLAFTGDQRRVKKVPEPEPEEEKEPEPEPEPEPIVEEIVESKEYCVVDAQPWDTSKGVNTSYQHVFKSVLFPCAMFVLSVLNAFVVRNIFVPLGHWLKRTIL